MRKHWLLLFVFPVLLALPRVEAQAGGEVELEAAWVRALPPTQPNTAAYLTITNRGAEAVEITGASSPLAGRVEIHTTREVDGLLRMERVHSLPLSPGASVSLAPGGLHLMLFELARMPADGESASLCVELANRQPVCTEAQVRKTRGGQSGDPHRHH